MTIRPPSTRRVVASGAKTPAMRASGFLPQTSSWHSADVWPTKKEQTFISVLTHAVEPQPLASAAEISILVRMSVSRPPKRFGTMMRNSPASRMALMFSSTTRRSCSVCTAFASSSGRRAFARSTRVSRKAVGVSAARSLTSTVPVWMTGVSRVGPPAFFFCADVPGEGCGCASHVEFSVGVWRCYAKVLRGSSARTFDTRSGRMEREQGALVVDPQRELEVTRSVGLLSQNAELRENQR